MQRNYPSNCSPKMQAETIRSSVIENLIIKASCEISPDRFPILPANRFYHFTNRMLQTFAFIKFLCYNVIILYLHSVVCTIITEVMESKEHLQNLRPESCFFSLLVLAVFVQRVRRKMSSHEKGIPIVVSKRTVAKHRKKVVREKLKEIINHFIALQLF